ncbi:MAG TPA: hypothetical protein VHM26_16840 [Chitinophagaceae bacterium]|jgi:hypothetical protein|nr:hypothetical protein [Chitinophagaceae bacterium]
MKKWLKYSLIGLGAFTVLGIIAVATDSGESEKTASSNTNDPSKPRDIPYTVGSKDESPRQITYRLVVNERADKASLIEIARKLKEETGWKDELVCFFNIGVHSSSGAWASAAYLPRCPECTKEKDKEGDPVDFDLIGMTASLADSLQQLKLDTIDNKQFLCSYLDDGWQCKTELYTVGNKPSRILMAKLFTTGRVLDWLKLKEVDGEKRYYFEDEPDSDSFVEIDYNAKAVHFRTEGNKTWQSYSIRTE